MSFGKDLYQELDFSNGFDKRTYLLGYIHSDNKDCILCKCGIRDDVNLEGNNIRYIGNEETVRTHFKRVEEEDGKAEDVLKVLRG